MYTSDFNEILCKNFLLFLQFQWSMALLICSFCEEVMACEVKDGLLPSEFVSPIFERV